MTGRARAALAALLVGAVLAGCSGGSDDPAPTTTEATTTTTEVPLATPPEVLDPGAEPRQALRLAYQPGDAIVLRYAVDLAVEQESGGRRQRLDSPPIVQLLRLTVEEVDGTDTVMGLAIESITVDGRDVDLSEEQVAALQAALDPLVGVTGTIRLDELGRTTDVAVDAPDDLPESAAASLAQLEDQLRQISPSLPEEEVGVGARWVARSDASGLAGGSIEGTLVQTVTLIGIEGDRLTYDATVEVLADPQDLALPDGTEASLSSAKVQGRSKGWFELGSPAQEADATTTGELQLAVGDDATPVDQRSSSVVRVTSQAP